MNKLLSMCTCVRACVCGQYIGHYLLYIVAIIQRDLLTSSRRHYSVNVHLEDLRACVMASIANGRHPTGPRKGRAATPQRLVHYRAGHGPYRMSPHTAVCAPYLLRTSATTTGVDDRKTSAPVVKPRKGPRNDFGYYRKTSGKLMK